MNPKTSRALSFALVDGKCFYAKGLSSEAVRDGWSSNSLGYFLPYLFSFHLVLPASSSARTKIQLQRMPLPSFWTSGHTHHRLTCQLSAHFRNNLKRAHSYLFFSERKSFNTVWKWCKLLASVWLSGRVNRLSINMLDSTLTAAWRMAIASQFNAT